MQNISALVEQLSLKDDKLRYQAFLTLQSLSVTCDEVYPHWDVFCEKLKSDNSYQRSIGLMLLAENVRWDTENKTADILGDYLALLGDEKPITIRQCVQSLGKIVANKPELGGKIAEALTAVDLMDIKETMRKSVLLDILNVLLIIGKEGRTEKTERFIQNALLGGILDKKSKKQFEQLL